MSRARSVGRCWDIRRSSTSCPQATRPRRLESRRDAPVRISGSTIRPAPSCPSCRGVSINRRGVAAMQQSSVVLLAGGVGGARLAHGLQAHIGGGLTVIVNTADDIERHGLLVSPDHDTVMYTLAGIDNREWGWGITGETFAAASMLERYGEDIWFRLGDRDPATHTPRPPRLAPRHPPTERAL